MKLATWHDITGHRNITEYVQEKLGIWSRQYNLKAIEEELEIAVMDELPDGYRFDHLAFYQDDDAEQPLIHLNKDGDLDLADVIESVDFWFIADNNEKTSRLAPQIRANQLI